MSFLKKLGDFAGDITGAVVSTPVRLAAHLTDSKLLHESADAVHNATRRSGRIVGRAASGIWDVAAGAVTRDSEKLSDGSRDIFGAVGDVATGLGQGIVRVGESAFEVGKGVVTGDMALAKQGAETLVKAGIVSVMAIGVADIVGVAVDVADGAAVDFGLPSAHDAVAVDSSVVDTVPIDTHVDGYFRHDGTYVHGYTSVHHDTQGFANAHMGDGDHVAATHADNPTTTPVVEHTHSYQRGDGMQVKGYNSVHHEV